MKQSILKCSLLVALCVCIATAFFTTRSSAGTAYAATTHAARPAISCPGVHLTPGATWDPGSWWAWTSCAGNSMKLMYQTNQNFVLYCNSSIIWSTGRHVNGYSADYTEFQPDGNLVVYVTDGPGIHIAIWASNTYNQGARYMQLQGDGNVVIYNGSNHALWATNTNGWC